jgi:Spy/CpxP family protein refolding chaperone
MSKNRFSILFAAAFLVSAVAAAASAQEGMGPPPGGPPPGGPMIMGGPGPMMMGGGPPPGDAVFVRSGPLPPPLMMVLRAAGLSDAQKKQVHEIMESSRKTVMPLMQQMHSIREQIADKLVSSGSVTTADMAPLLTQQSQIQQQLDSNMVSTAIQIRGVLTSDQLAKVAAANTKLKQIHSEIESILGPPDAAPAP